MKSTNVLVVIFASIWIIGVVVIALAPLNSNGNKGNFEYCRVGNSVFKIELVEAITIESYPMAVAEGEPQTDAYYLVITVDGLKYSEKFYSFDQADSAKLNLLRQMGVIFEDTKEIKNAKEKIK